MKTASLISCSCRVGGIISGVNEEGVKHLSNYGRYLGLIYQISDDMLDYISDSSELGKPVMKDLKEGVPTLPLIYYLNQKSEVGIEQISVSEVVDGIELDTASFKYTYDKMLHYSMLAKEELEYFSDRVIIDKFNSIVDSILYRVNKKQLNLNINTS